MRAVSCRTVDADDISADRAVSSRRNGQHRGHNLHGRRVRVHEPDEHLGVADVAGRRVLPSRYHLSHSHNKRHWPPTSPKPPVTGRFTVNAVRQEPRRGPELVPDDSQCLLGQKRQQGPPWPALGSRLRPMRKLRGSTKLKSRLLVQVITPAAGPEREAWGPIRDHPNTDILVERQTTGQHPDDGKTTAIRCKLLQFRIRGVTIAEIERRGPNQPPRSEEWIPPNQRAPVGVTTPY